MFTKSARFYDTIYSWKDYEAESRRVAELIKERNPRARTLLDVACGTGHHLDHLKGMYEASGLDSDEDMVRLARERHPELSIHQADMADFNLSQTFDTVICLFSSIGYALSVDRLRQSIATMARHLNAGGILIVEPWLTPEAFEGGKPFALFVDETDLKIASMDVPEVDGRISVITFHYLVATEDGVENFTELHRLGLFADEEYMDAFEDAGLEVEHDPVGLMGRGLYVGARR